MVNLNPTYDTVVLAAGRNTRLKGIVPSFMKPLMIVNGRPLIVSILKNVTSFSQHVVVVVSPENCAMIAEVLAANGLLDDIFRVTIIVQPEAKGPGEGLLRALHVCHSKRVMLVCGDNIVPHADYNSALIADTAAVNKADEESYSILTASVMLTDDEADAQRFTRVEMDQKSLIEGEPGGLWPDGLYRCWVGPLIFDRSEGAIALASEWGDKGYRTKELKISGALSCSIPNLDVVVVNGTSVDVGTPDALMQLTEN